MCFREFRALVLVGILALAALWIYLGVFTRIPRDIFLGTDQNGERVGLFQIAFFSTLPCALALILISCIALLLRGIDAVKDRSNRRLYACPRCGMRAGATLKFEHKPIEGTAWKSITCPRCGHSWHARR